MLKKLQKILMFSILAVFLWAGSALAINLDYYTGNPADSVYGDTFSEYVYLTDLTPPASAPMIQLSTSIISTYNHDYVIGIFDMTGGHSVDLAVLDTYLGITSSNIIFDVPGGTVESSTDNETMDTFFGFYIQFYTDIGSGILSSEIHYSDAINDAFYTFYDPAGIESLNFSEMGLGVGGPGTLGHALVSVDDVAPVHEPATMLLLGTGLIGLCFFRRKKLFKR